MRIPLAGLLLVFLLALVVGFMGGCGPAPPCETSLVTLDETRLDVETYEQEAAETAKRMAELEEQLATKTSQVREIENKPAELEKEVHELKKGSGRE
jgi:septal ring factor EnvC (AmiA/AmiB activator)